MAEIRLNKVLKELNVTIDRVVDFLDGKGISLDINPNSKISQSHYDLLLSEFGADKEKKEKIKETSKKIKEEIKQNLINVEQKKIAEQDIIKTQTIKISPPKELGEIDIQKLSPRKNFKNERTPVLNRETPPKEIKPEIASEQPKQKEPVSPVTQKEHEFEKIETKYKKLTGPTFTGEVLDLSKFEKLSSKKTENKSPSDVKTKSLIDNKKKKRKRISPFVDKNNPTKLSSNNSKPVKEHKKREILVKPELSDREISKQIKETLDKLTNKSSNKSSAKYRRSKRDEHKEKALKELEYKEKESKLIKITEFITVQDLANMMDVSPTEIISSCMMLGMMTTINQRLDAETISIIAEEFGFEAEFVKTSEENEKNDIDNPKDLETRAPIVVVMGHVDHGKTSLLDHIRNTNVIAGESGNITQHIGAYSVQLKNKQKITFLDTPGHEAFTAMRARGTKVTDIAVIVIAADDNIMPQTKEAISHAQAASIPFVIAINKIDKPAANPDKVRESLSNMNIIVEEWGGNVQCQEISAKTGKGVRDLLDKILLQAEIMELKANPNKFSSGTVIEAYLDKGRGYVSTVLVQNGTLKIGDFMLAGTCTGKVKTMFDERGNVLKEAVPSTPVSILGLNGAPQSGDIFRIYENEKEAKNIAIKKEQLKREQSMRVKKHITLDEIGRRIAVGEFKELNLIIKGDVDGSVEAISDSLQKLSTQEIQINVIHKGVGQINESDILLATSSDAIVVGFQVRASNIAKKLADTEEIDIRYYSIIYDIINDIRDAMEGMLSPEFKEEIVANVEIREIFKVSKVGTIAGCMVTNGKITRNTKVRVIRDGVVVYTGVLGSLKRFKDDVKEVTKGYECGLNIEGYNNIEIGDIIEGYDLVAVKKKL